MEENQNIEENEINSLNQENQVSEESKMPEIKEEQLERLDNTSQVDFLNVTPKATTPKWAIIGQGIEEIENSYGAKTKDEHWVIEKNERHSVGGYSLSSDYEQTALKGDEVFDYIDNLKYYMKTGTDLETDKLEIDKYRVDETGETPKYRARLFKVIIVIDSDSRKGGEDSKIKYKIQPQGDPKFGKVTFNNGVPTFTEETAASN